MINTKGLILCKAERERDADSDLKMFERVSVSRRQYCMSVLLLVRRM